MSPTIKYLQEYLRSKDYHGGDPTPYFHKLVEEVGELSRAILLEEPHTDGVNIKGTVDEENLGRHILRALRRQRARREP